MTSNCSWCSCVSALIVTSLPIDCFKSRITALAEQTRAGEAPTDDGYQLHQAKQLLALGGWTGSWLGDDASRDRTAYYVPESHTDAIAVAAHETVRPTAHIEKLSA